MSVQLGIKPTTFNFQANAPITKLRLPTKMNFIKPEILSRHKAFQTPNIITYNSY